MSRLAVLVALCGCAGFGQDSINSSSSPAGFGGSVHFGGQPGFRIPVTGAPYSGEVVTETKQTLADGTHIKIALIPMKVYRDSSGRTREERPFFGGSADKAPPGSESLMIIEIYDPVARFRYLLDSQGKVAHRQVLFVPERPASRIAGGGGGAPAAISASPNLAPATQPARAKVSQETREKLEPQIIEGVLAEGTRTTTIWPEGSQGNDRPIAAVVESWRSKELQIPLLIKTFDPRAGEHTVKLTNVSRSTPDSSLFQPPPDYTVVDEKEDFAIQYGPIPW